MQIFASVVAIIELQKKCSQLVQGLELKTCVFRVQENLEILCNF